MDLAREFFELYQGLPRAHGVYWVGEAFKGKQQGRAETVLEAPTVEMWQQHLNGVVGLGIIPIHDDATVRWGAVDVDVYPLDLDDLFRKVTALDLPVVLLRSKSGGAHLTCFAKEDVPAKLMRSKLLEMATALGYPKVEIFPKQIELASERDVGNWLNMPYFDEAKTTRYALNKGHQLTATQFISYAKKVSVTAAELENLEINLGPDFADGPPCLQTMARQGVPQGTRNDAMFAFGVYCRNKYGDGWLEELAAVNENVCSPPISIGELRAVTNSLSRKEYFYPCKRAPCVNFCNQELCRKRKFGIGQQSDDLNLTLGPLTKITYDNQPLWILTVDGVNIEFETEQLTSQASFHKQIIESLNIWPNKIKPSTWQQLVQDKLNNVIVVVPPKDSSVDGRFMALLEQFLTTTALARTQDELLQGKPWTENGVSYFRSIDMMNYLERQHFRAVTQRGAWNILRREGAVHAQFQIKGRCVMAWGIKEFQRQNEPHDVPDISQREF